MSIAHERIRQLFDDNAFESMDDLEPSIHILAAGKIAGRRAYCCAGIPEARKADIHMCFQRKIEWLESIRRNPAPIVWLHDAPPQAPGGRTPIPAHSDELLASNTGGVGRAFCLQARLNGLVPQFSALFGDCGAAQSFPVRLADFVLLKRGSHLWIGRPDAVRLMLGQAPDAERLGGAEMHCKVSGVGDALFERDSEAIAWIRKCAACLPAKSGDALPVTAARPPAMPPENMAKLVHPDLNKPFDMRPVLACLTDADSWIGVQELYAGEIVIGLARIEGMPLGVLANNSGARGGVIYPETCRKMTRFIRFCDAYRIPMLFMADNPGLMVGEASEQAGMLNEATELLRALAACRAPRACLVIRKAYTVGLYAMSGPGFDPDRFWAAPHASISVFGPKALEYFAREGGLPPAAVEAIREMHHHAVEPRDYEEKGLLSAVVDWPDLRKYIAEFLAGVSEHAPCG